MRPGGLFGGETSFDKNRVSFSEIPSAYIKEKNIDKCVEFMQKALSVDENVKDRDTQISLHVLQIEHEPLYTQRDLDAMVNLNARCENIQSLGKAYTDSARSQLAITKSNSLDSDKMKEHLVNIVYAESINQEVIVPAYRESKQPVKQKPASAGVRKADSGPESIRSNIEKAPTFIALTKLTSSRLSKRSRIRYSLTPF